jgi:hypothetical protein
MKKNLPILILCTAIASILYACDVFHAVVKEQTGINTEEIIGSALWKQFNQQSPITTTFDDAIYEAPALHDFEPEEMEYRPMDIQPKAPGGGYILQSGVYTINAKSFCLRGYTHGPTRGDGHLYAPLKGQKADLIQAILERYGNQPNLDQRNIQVLLWAIISGADMNKLGEQHAATLHQLFSPQELLEFQGRDMLKGFAQDQLRTLKKMAIGNTKLSKVLEADTEIRRLVVQNRPFEEIERIAILPGIAPARDMVREVSKGRWSYHPNGFFVRFFPKGYPQTRVDVYVPHEGDLAFDAAGRPRIIENDTPKVKEVIFNPATMVASPANQSSQRIGTSDVPVKRTPFPKRRGARNVVPFYLPQVAFLSNEGERVNGSYAVQGSAMRTRKDGEEVLTVVVNGTSMASRIGQVRFKGDVTLLVDGRAVETISFGETRQPEGAQPLLGSSDSDLHFPIAAYEGQRLSIRIEAGYEVALRSGGFATPTPSRLREEVKI